jgi:hypothetical protein
MACRRSPTPGRLAARTLWAGIAELVVMARYRAPAWLVRQGTVALAVYVAARIDRRQPRHGVRVLQLRRGGRGQ